MQAKDGATYRVNPPRSASCCASSPIPSTILIRDARDLERLQKWRPRYERIRVALKTMTVEQCGALERELERYYNECGCNAGKWGLIVGLIVAASVGTYSLRFNQLSAFQVMGLGFGIVVAFTGSAKFLSVIVARLKLRRIIDGLVVNLRSNSF